MYRRDRIVTAPTILLGKPVINRTRISLGFVLGWLAMLSEPSLADGFLVVISEHSVRHK